MAMAESAPIQSGAGKRSQQPQKKIPMRQCLGCNEHKPKMELIRVVRSPEGEISLDFRGKKSGRGAYVCRNVACLKRARKSGRILRNLSVESVPEEVWTELEQQMEAGDREQN